MWPTYLLIGLAILLLFSTLKVLPEYQRLVVLRLGRALPQAKGPGLVIVIPDHRHAHSGRHA
jgi:regulator of protease activity HflC (stomatin/prohibitin superfamily)